MNRQSARPRKSRPHNAEATRRTLLAAATHVFAEVGFAGARVDVIAARARVNKRMIYAYFGDKLGLYRETLASRFGLVAEIGHQLESEDDPRAEAEALIRWYFHLLAEDPPFVRLLVWELLTGSGRAREMLIESATAGLDLLLGVLRRGVARGVFRPGLDPEKVRSSAIGLCLGYFLQKSILESRWRRERARPWPDEAVLAHTCRLLFDGIRAGEERP